MFFVGYPILRVGLSIRCDPIFKKKDIKKGVAFPTCISLNHFVGHFAPLGEDKVLLQ